MSLADVTSWSLPTPAQHIAWLERLIKAGEATAAHSLNPKRASRRPHKCQMVFRNHLSPLDTYCYLKARFGEPNGPMIQMKEDRADSWIHWDYLLFFEHYFIHIMGLTKEIHVHVDSNYSQEKDFWISLVKNLRVEFQKLARPKSDVERSLEKWVIFSTSMHLSRK